MKRNLPKLLSLSLISFYLISCGHPDDDDDGDAYEVDAIVSGAPPLMWPQQSWADHTLSQVKSKRLAEVVPQDIRNFCPQYESFSSEKREFFWTELMAVMAKKESSHNPDLKYTESFSDGNGNRVISRGLFQLSIESANQRAYSCGFSSAAQIHDPVKNITCSSNILNHWIQKDNRIGGADSSGKWVGGGRYWSVLRKGSSFDFIKSKTKLYCQKLSQSSGTSGDFSGVDLQAKYLILKDGFNSGRPQMKDKVLELQNLLVKAGYDVATDGFYGSDTASVVLDFQADHNLPQNRNVVTLEMIQLLRKI